MKVIINNRFRRMAQATEGKCHLPLFISGDADPQASFLDALRAVFPEQVLRLEVDSDFSSVWVDLAANTILRLDAVNNHGYSRILGANNKLSDIDWSKLKVYVQLGHFEVLPERYQIQQDVESNEYQILRFNFRYNYYVPMHKLPLFKTEQEAENYTHSQLEGWEI